MIHELYLVASIATLAVISSGSDFAITTKNTILYGRQSGYATALGIAVSTWVHTFYCLAGIALIISKSPTLFHAIKLLGIAYLFYIGVTTLTSKFHGSSYKSNTTDKTVIATSFKQGLFSNVTNPKTTLFYLSLFTMVVSKSTPLYIQIVYGLIICLLHLIWFCLVAYLISHPKIKTKFDKNIPLVNKIIGVILILIAMRILLTVI